MLEELHIINEAIPEDQSDDYRVLVSNVYNYFE